MAKSKEAFVPFRYRTRFSFAGVFYICPGEARDGMEKLHASRRGHTDRVGPRRVRAIEHERSNVAKRFFEKPTVRLVNEGRHT